MSRVYESVWNEKGNCIFSREGYAGEAVCPVCGYPIGATFWDDGEVQLDECPICKGVWDEESDKNTETT